MTRILKWLAIIAGYGVLLSMMRPLGMTGVIAALVSGTAFAGMILLAGIKDVVPLLRITTYMLIGGVLAGAIPASGSHGDAEVRQVIRAITGVIFGAVIATIVTHSRERGP